MAASTSGGGIVALAFELDDLELLLFMLFSKRCSALRPSARQSHHRDRRIRISQWSAETLFLKTQCGPHDLRWF
jgi:hypothetical protein